MDRRIERIEDINDESEDNISEEDCQRRAYETGMGSENTSEIARTYVGELITKVENNYGQF